MKQANTIVLVASLALLMAVTTVYTAPTSENAPAIILSSGNSNSTSNINMTHVMERVGRFLAIGIGLGIGGGGFGYGGGYPYPCSVYGYPAPYAPAGSYPCGNPYFFG